MPQALPSAFALRICQGRYCDGEEFAVCARLRETEQGHPVPGGMLPSGHVLAAAI